MQGILSRNFFADFDIGIFVCRVPAATTARWCAGDHPQRALFQQRAEEIQSLPNNRTNEMIRGCEIRSLSGGPPSRPLHDDPVEHRLVVHGF
jgi:hypothetical protein